MGRCDSDRELDLVNRDPILIDLALQGGGAHGAFTWGVLDRLLEEPWLRIDGISGTSAGAMNAVVLADGSMQGGGNGARAALEGFWRKVSDAALLSPFRRGPLDILMGRWTLDSSPTFIAMDLMARLFSPFDLNPGGVNPLRDILAECVDFSRVANSPIKLFVTATNVRSGRGHVFRNGDLTPDVLLASACLPTLFQAIEIDGEAYWDGGFAGNPTITPLIRECTSRDTILVPINPLERPGPPRGAREILDRVNEVSFNAVTLKELKMIALMRQWLIRERPKARLGRNARSHGWQPDHDGARLLLQTQRRMGVPQHAAGRGAPRRRNFSRRECRQSRETLFDRPRPVVGRSVRPLSKV